MKKFTFSTFMKIFGISFGSLVGVLGITLGTMKLVGALDEPEIYPTQIMIESNEYNIDNGEINVDGNFKVKITATTDAESGEVTKKDIVLSLLSANAKEDAENGTISDDAITIPKYVKVGEEFEVIVNKTINDPECGVDWITGGHSEIRATSKDNPQNINSARLKVNVDVPVYSVEIETRAFENESDNNEFVLNSKIYASLKFTPKRSEYQFSQDGKNGTSVVKKNTYFTIKNNNYENVIQQGTTNIFDAKTIGNSTIVGYCYRSAIIEDNQTKEFRSETDEQRYADIMQDLDKNYTGENAKSFKCEKEVSVVPISVDSLSISESGKIKDTKKGIEYKIYANKSDVTDSTESNLGITLSSKFSKASLQANLKYVGIRFYIVQNETEIDCVSDESFKLIDMDEEYYSSMVTKNGKTYFLPVLTQNIENYYWKFAVKELYKGSIFVEIAYLEEGSDIESKVVSFRTEEPESSTISWDITNKDLSLKILDNEDSVNYKSINLAQFINVPKGNQFQTVKYFVYFDYDTGNIDYTNLIVCSQSKEYTLGLQKLKLYELENGILQAKSQDAHNLTVHCIYATVETYLGEPKIVNGCYIFDQYSYNTKNDSIDKINVTIEKTVKSFESYLDLVGSVDDLITETTDDQKSKFAFVQGYEEKINSFDLCIKNKVENETEKEIFKQAIRNGEISVVAFVDDAEQVLSKDSSETLITFIAQNLIEYDDYVIQKYKVYIGKLSDSEGDPKITFSIRYIRTDGDYKDYPIEYKITKVNGQDTTPISADYIEIYSGKATVFAFNYNYDEDSGKVVQKTSVNSPIVETSTIEENNNIINNIKTSYKFEGNLIADIGVLFELDANNNPTQLKIKMSDKYGRTPIYSDYYFEESSNDSTKILSFSDDHHYTFVKDGSATLVLKSKNDNTILDTLYLKREGSGELKTIKVLNQKSDNTFEQKDLPENDASVKDILEKTMTIDIVGAKGTTIDFTSTVSGAMNLVEYIYSFVDSNNDTKEASLKQMTKFKITEGWISESYSEYININDEKLTDISDVEINKLTFTRNFGGQNIRLKVFISVPELGISQYVILNIKSNISIQVSQDKEVLPEIVKDNTSYVGYYSEKYYTFTITVNYNNFNGSSFADNYATYFAFKLDNKIISTTTTFAKLENDFDIDQSNQKKIVITARIAFSAFEEQNKCMKLTFTTYDTKSNDPENTLYIYVKQNIKATMNSDVLYLSTQNISTTVTTTGTIDLTKYISLERLTVADIGIDTSKITYELDAQSKANGYEIVGTILKCNKQLTQLDSIKIIIKYNNCEIATLPAIISPNIRENNSNSDWITYNDARYVKLIGGKTYNQNELKQMVYSDDDATTNIQSIVISNSEYITVIDQEYTIRSLQKIITDNIKMTVTLTNGNYLVFNVILLPQDLPYVAYEIGDDRSFDIYKSFNEEYLAQNNYYTTVKSGDNIDIRDLKGDGSNYGILLQNSADVSITFTTNNSDFVKVNSDNTLKILPTARNNEYVFIYARVSFGGSITTQTIPYRLLIEKELNLKIYYPYQSGESNFAKQDEQTLISPSSDFDREYITVDSNGKAEISLLESQSIFVPNKSTKESKRIALFKQSEEYEGGYTVKFEVSRVFYTTIKGETVVFTKASDIASYASIINNKLMLNTKNMPKVRVEIKVSTLGAEGYYYISAGEIPYFELCDTSGDKINEINITAGESIELDYILNKITKDDSDRPISTEDSTNLLNMFTTQNSLSEQELELSNSNPWTLFADDCPSDWTSVLVAYTKYGEVQQIKVNIKSNYDVTPKDYDKLSGYVTIFDNTTINKTNFEAIKNENNVEKSITIQNMEVLSTISDDIARYVNFTTNSIIIGAVDKEVEFTFNLKFDLGTNANGKDIIYTREYKYIVKPSLGLNSVDSQTISETNKLEVKNINKNADGTAVVTVELYSNDLDNTETPLFVKANSSNEITVGKFSISLISEVALKDKYVFSSTVDGNITEFSITCPRVANQTIVSFKIEYYNEFNNQKYVIYTGYIVFTLNENFKVETNYPQQSENSEINHVEYFYVGEEDNASQFKLTANSILGTSARVKIKVGDDYITSYDDFYVTAKANSKTTQISVGGDNEYKSFTSTFTFKLTERQDDVSFTIYIKISDQYFAVGEYLVKICKAIEDVWTIKTFNFNNNSNSENSAVNKEQIFIGSSDEVTKTIKVNIKTISNLDTNKKYYFEIVSLFGTQVTQSERVLATEGTTTITLYLSSTNALVEEKFNQDITSGFYLYEDETRITNDSILSAFKFQVTEISTRIKLYYNSIECGIDKLYSVTNVGSLSYDEDYEYASITLNKDSSSSILGYYYYTRVLDAEFTQYKFDIKTGDTVNLVYGNGCDLTAGLKRRSNDTYYSIYDLQNVDSTSQIAIKQVGDIEYTGENTETKNYLFISQKDFGSRVIDYTMLAMGAPNTSVTASITFEIIINDNSEKFTFELTISNDYGSSLSTLNSDGSQNSEGNPCVVTPTSSSRLYNSVTFATLNKLVIDENEWIFIQHTGTVTEGIKGNLSPLFKITLDDSKDTQYITRSEDANTLTFLFDKVEFGNKYYRLIFSDEYGYTFDYYITLNATYDATYTQGTISVFEQHYVQITSTTKMDANSYTKIPITFTNDIDIDKVVIVSLTFIYKDSQGNSQTKIIDPLDGRLFRVPYLSDLQESAQVSGRLDVELMFNENKAETKIFKINFVIKPQYTIKTIDDEVYVRDDVSFDILDIVEVVSNENPSVIVGERYLEKTESTKIILNSSFDELTKELTNAGEKPEEYILASIGLAARNSNGKLISEQSLKEIALSGESIIYENLYDRFDLTSTDNITFEILLYDSCGNKYYISDSKGQTIYLKNLGLYTSEGKLSEDITIKFYKYTYTQDGKEYSIYLSQYSNSENSSTVVVDNHTYKLEEEVGTLKISKNSQIIKDQVLKIGVSDIRKYGENSVNVYFTNNEILQVSCQNIENQVISLVENKVITSGNYTELATKIVGSTYINNGLSQESLAKLKDFNIKSVKDGNNSELHKNSGGYKLNLKAPGENTELDWNTTTLDGTTFIYQNQKLTIDLEYNKEDNEESEKYGKSDSITVDCKVTLKFISVDKSQAYGTSTLKFVNLTGKNEDNTTIELTEWAGTDGDTTAFKLDEGFTNAVSYQRPSVYFNDNISSSSGKLTFKISESTDSASGGEFASISDSGAITLFKSFDISKYYLPVDICLSNSVDGTHVISTVRLAFRVPAISTIVQNSGTLIVENGSAKKQDILKLFNIQDTSGNIWTSDNIGSYFNNASIYLINGNNKINVFSGTGTDISIDTNQSIQITYGNTVLTGYKTIATRYNENCLQYISGVETFNIGAKWDRYFVGTGETTKYQMPNITEETINKVSEYLGFTNTMGYIDKGSVLSFKVDDSVDTTYIRTEIPFYSDKYTCTAKRNTTSWNYSDSYTLTYSYGTTTLGSVTVTFWDTNVADNIRTISSNSVGTREFSYKFNILPKYCQLFYPDEENETSLVDSYSYSSDGTMSVTFSESVSNGYTALFKLKYTTILTDTKEELTETITIRVTYYQS